MSDNKKAPADKASADERGKRTIKLSETQEAQAREASALLDKMREEAKP